MHDLVLSRPEIREEVFSAALLLGGTSFQREQRRGRPGDVGDREHPFAAPGSRGSCRTQRPTNDSARTPPRSMSSHTVSGHIDAEQRLGRDEGDRAEVQVAEPRVAHPAPAERGAEPDQHGSPPTMNAAIRKWTTRIASAMHSKHGTTIPEAHPREHDARAARGRRRDHRRAARRGARPVHRADPQPRARAPHAEARRAPALERQAAAARSRSSRCWSPRGAGPASTSG